MITSLESGILYFFDSLAFLRPLPDVPLFCLCGGGTSTEWSLVKSLDLTTDSGTENSGSRRTNSVKSQANPDCGKVYSQAI